MRLGGVTLRVFVLTVAMIPVASASARPAARTWSVTPRSNVQLGAPLTFTGTGCSKPGTPSSHLEIALGSNFGLVAHVPVADAAGNWRITTRVTPSPGHYEAIFDAGCIDNGGHFAAGGSKAVFVYSTKLTVTYVAGVELSAFPIRALDDHFVRDTLGFFTYPRRAGRSDPPSNFVATVAWGDGITSNAQVVIAPPALNGASPSSGAYELLGGHSYSKPQATTMTVKVTPAGGTTVSSRATVNVDPNHASPVFQANPPSLSQKEIGLMIPEEVRPDQPDVVARRWHFGDAASDVDVVDSAQTRPRYAATLNALVTQPDNAGARAQGVALGILPRDANDLIGGLTGGEVRQVAQVWQAYWPSHVVPHLYDYRGQFSVRQTVTDKKNTSTSFDRTMNISFGCPPWGGPLAGLFRGYTLCNTFDGIATQFGPHRHADYTIYDFSKGLGQLGSALKFGGGVSLIITPGVLKGFGDAAYLTIHLGAGVGVSLGHTVVGRGWVGPPDQEHHPSTFDIRRFVDGVKIDGGGDVRFVLAGQNLGLGFNAVYNVGTGQAGEETFTGGTAFAAHIGISCSWPLSHVGPGVLATLKSLYSDWANPDNNPALSTLAPLDDIPSKLTASGFDLGEAAISALKACAS